jgi:hypothetical protein
VLVRGNHELNGSGAEHWFDTFQMPGEKGYYSFCLGDIMFIVLECGAYCPKEPFTAESGPMLDLKTLFRRQTAWLEKLRKSEAFRKAKYRVVLSHVEPQIEDGTIERYVHAMTENLLSDTTPEGKIDLWIAGHIHRYYRSNRGSEKLIPPYKPKKQVKKIAPVTWVTVDGPKGDSSQPDFSYLSVNVTDKKITIKAIDENAKLIDSFEVTID